MKPRVLLLAVLLLGAAGGCGVQEQADAAFGDQHFKTAIALIELHKVRTGAYPATLADLKFTGEWDKLAISSVAYRRLDAGYELDIVRGWVGQPKVAYPVDFWTGLGLQRSNLKPSP